MTVTFCGHAQISQSEKIEKWLYDVTQKLIEQGATTFYLGGYGAFDSLVASVLRETPGETLPVTTAPCIRRWKLSRAVLLFLIGTAGW